MNLDRGQPDPEQGIAEHDRGMREPARIDENSRSGSARRVDPVDQPAFVVGLLDLDREPELRGARGQGLVDLPQGLGAVDLRLAHTKEVQVRAMEHQYRWR